MADVTNWYTKTFTAASSAVANYLDLGELPVGNAPTGNPAIGAQVLRVWATGNHASGTATLQLVLAAPDSDGTTNAGVIWAEDSSTCQPYASARRTDFDNAGGNYACQVIFPTSGNNMVDVLGLGFGGTKLYLGCTVLTNFTRLTVYVGWSRAN